MNESFFVWNFLYFCFCVENCSIWLSTHYSQYYVKLKFCIMNVVKTSKMKDGAEVSCQLTLYSSMFEASCILKVLQCFADRNLDDHSFREVVEMFTEAEQLTLRRIMWSMERS